MRKTTQDKAKVLATCANDGMSSCPPYRVVVCTPVSRSIPLFAIDIEKGRDEVELVVLTSVRALRQAVGRKAVNSLLRGHYNTFRLVQSRHRSGRTATYSAWLEFAEAGNAEDFLRDFPEVSFDAEC